LHEATTIVDTKVFGIDATEVDALMPSWTRFSETCEPSY